MRRHLLLATAASLVAGGAFAADLPIVEPAPIYEAAPLITNWTGVYVGLQGGYAGNWFSDGGNNDIDTDGFVGGGHVGYLHQFQGGFVLGVEGDVEYSGIDGANSATAVVGRNVIRARVSQDFDVNASARLRAGYAFGNILAYATGGYAYAHADTAAGFSVNNVTVDRVSRSEGLNGYTVGGGVEALLAEKISLGVEYRYTDLENSRVQGRGVIPDFKVDNDFHAIRARVSYHF